jgi:hypothetical protein
MVNLKLKNNKSGQVEQPPSKVNASDSLMTAFGIHEKGTERGSAYYQSLLYGPERIVDGITFHKPASRHWFVDVVGHWERVMGRFWIRAQMAHYLWRPSVGLQSEIDLRIPKNLLPSSSQSSGQDNRFIGMHIRFTDNLFDFWKDFGRDGAVTRSLAHFMDIAGDIRNETGISTVYLATDSTLVLKQLQNSTYAQEGWSFQIQNGVIRSDVMNLMWFKNIRDVMAAGIGTDVEVLRRADYLIGSHQSNVFRLATELNTAYHVAKYPLDMNRHRTVDIEWYEDP